MCLEHRRCLVLPFHLRSCFTVCLTLLCISPLSLRPGVAGVCSGVPLCELLCLVGLCHVISGILAGGIPGFRMVLCCFTHSLVWPGGLGVFVLFVALPYHTEMIQGYHLLHQLTHFTQELEPVTLLSCLCGLFFWFAWFCVFVFLCCCVLFVFGVLVLFRFVLW